MITLSNQKTEHPTSITSSQCSQQSSKKHTTATYDSLSNIKKHHQPTYIQQQQPQQNIPNQPQSQSQNHIQFAPNMIESNQININISTINSRDMIKNSPKQQQQQQDQGNLFRYLLYHKNSVNCILCVFFILTLIPLLVHGIMGTKFYLTFKDYFDLMGNDLFWHEWKFFAVFGLSLLCTYLMFILGFILFFLTFSKKSKCFKGILTLLIFIMLIFVASTVIFLLFSGYKPQIEDLETQCDTKTFSLSYWNSNKIAKINQNQHNTNSNQHTSNQQQEQQQQINSAQSHQVNKILTDQKCPHYITEFLDQYQYSITGSLVGLIFYPILELGVIIIGMNIQKNKIKVDKNRKQIITNNGNNNSFRAY